MTEDRTLRTGSIRDVEIHDEATGRHLAVKNGDSFLKLSVDGRDYFFDRWTGEYTGTGMDLRQAV